MAEVFWIRLLLMAWWGLFTLSAVHWYNKIFKVIEYFLLFIQELFFHSLIFQRNASYTHLKETDLLSYIYLSHQARQICYGPCLRKNIILWVPRRQPFLQWCLPYGIIPLDLRLVLTRPARKFLKTWLCRYTWGSDNGGEFLQWLCWVDESMDSVTDHDILF